MGGWSAVGGGVEANLDTNEEASGSRGMGLMRSKVGVTVVVTRAESPSSMEFGEEDVVRRRRRGLEDSHGGRRLYSFRVVETSVVVEVETDDGVADNHSAVDEVVVDESAVGGAVIDELKTAVESAAVDDSVVGDVSELVKFTVRPQSVVNEDQTHLAPVSITKAIAAITSYPNKGV